MNTNTYIIRKEIPSDIRQIDAVTKAAFSSATHASGTEHLIVRALRAYQQLTISLVAVAGDQLIGHVAISPVTVSSGEAGWFGLGPVSVLPAWQGAGVGSSLIRAAMAALQESSANGCVVLGEPAYYGRFGFRVNERLRYPEAPAEYFQVLAFDKPVPEGTVQYHDAFYVTE
ncbi:GNAT family N-acetyltransferase [Chitinophaga qingshengii]|uniref:N-acetyltransferase n=1 Tax=Chitinophaga qingshengii TaxID=1569794 RepID=A0ABR7TVU0_9BACT|nr:N-acetyltransferase [Chitinophaga qingshengii]MBC9934170.1 N-acetyltransferase [Chitinophaga qingshengii]